MKTMVKLAVLLATLLLLSGAAFAECECYTINATDLDNPEDSCTRDVQICFDFGSHKGIFTSPKYVPFPKTVLMPLNMYFDAMNRKMSGSLALFDAVSLKFHGDSMYVVTGELSSTNLTKFCGYNGYHRYALHGYRAEMCGEQSVRSVTGTDNLIEQLQTLLESTLGPLIDPE
jgi:hypothetical protein